MLLNFFRDPWKLAHPTRSNHCLNTKCNDVEKSSEPWLYSINKYINQPPHYNKTEYVCDSSIWRLHLSMHSILIYLEQLSMRTLISKKFKKKHTHTQLTSVLLFLYVHCSADSLALNEPEQRTNCAQLHLIATSLQC